MLSKKFSNILSVSGIALAGLWAFAGCRPVYEDLPECPAQLGVRFVYDYNLKFADAFRHEVKSVNVWAFDETGALVWSDTAAGEVLAERNFTMETPLPDGTYDFIAWCGLLDNEAYTLDTYTPASKEELEVKLNAVDIDGTLVSKTRIAGLYHGISAGEKFEADPYRPSIKTVDIPLMKDNKDIRVMLQHLDGSPIENRDFSVSITVANSWLGWDNEIIPGCPTVCYRPWNIKYGEVSAPEQSRTRTVTTVASLLFELSTGRLMENSNAVLTVHRNWDDRDIIRIPLIDYLLLVKGHYGEDISDQEYLDRQDDYSMVFFIDAASNWYVAEGIYINKWAVVPPQDSSF